MKRRHWLASTAALAVAPWVRAQGSDNWPSRPIRLVVPGPPGGGTDILARLLGEKLSAALKQPVIIDNKPGANGMLASAEVARAAPDGQTLLFSFASAMAINPSLYARAPDPVKDFEAVAQIGLTGNVLLASQNLPVRSFKELVAYAKARPGELNYASWGTGSGGHLTMESLLQRAGLRMTHVPYKGTAPIIVDLLGGTLQLGWTDVSSPVQYIESGKLRALAVSGTQRVPHMPQVPTLTEEGYPFETAGWYGVFAPARTPVAIVERLNALVVATVGSPEFKARLDALNLPNSPTPTAREFAQLVAKDTTTWRSILQGLGIKPE
ncbi:Bug family tripartite tricarboxylate transporter substrate binding protein [Variovorax soli]